MMEDATALYGFGSQGVPAVCVIAKCRADLMIDVVVGKGIPILVVPDEAQSVDLIIGRTFTELPYVAYTKLGDSLHFWHEDQRPFSHMEPLVSCPKLRSNAVQETTPQTNIVNWVTLSPQSNVADSVLFDNCGREIVIDMKGGEIIVPALTSGEEDGLLGKGQPLAQATEVDIPGWEKIKEGNCKEECGAVELEQIPLTETQRPIMCEEIRVGLSVKEVQRRKLARFSFEYQDCFATNFSEIGCTPILMMDTQEVPDGTPFAVQPYRTKSAKREAMRDTVGEWEKVGIGTESFCP